MIRVIIQFFLVFFIITLTAKSQVCTNLGQTPATAFPVCGTDVFSQSSVPVCANNFIPTFCPADNGIAYEDLNPYWYKFTCFQSGTLGFLIQPNNPGDDYDWQLFDVTDRDINDVFSSASTIVAYDWSGEVGTTGAANGNSLFVCATTPEHPVQPIFSKKPNLIEGHRYLLMISHFAGDQQSGYHLSFGGGTAVITDFKDPAMQSVTTNCDATQLRIKLNKKMKCPTLVADGTDFVLSPGNITITAAQAASCTRGFDMDSILLTLSGPLPIGNYTLTAVNGSDANTLKDNCDRTIPVGQKLDFTIEPLTPTPIDSLAPVKCATRTLQFVFKRPVFCNSIAPDGSDFILTGTSPITITGARGECSDDGLTSVVDLTLSSTIYNAGNFQIQLVAGADGNTIINECGLETALGQTMLFSTKDTVSAAFTYIVDMGCKKDSIRYFHNGAHQVNSYTWTFDTTGTSTAQNPSYEYAATGNYSTQLTVSNGFCTATATANIALDNEVTVDFSMPELICPEDSASFINNSKGPIDTYTWNFGDTHTSSAQSPPAERYPTPGRLTYYTVSLTVHSPIGCTQSMTKKLTVMASCYISVPTAFTPNGDGLNDYLYPLGALKANNLSFHVYNRWGQLVFHSNDWLTKWDGTVNGKPQPTGTYVWLLQFTNRDNGKKVEMKGTTTLIR